MSGTNTRTLELEKLYVRDIIYKDSFNNPIPRDRVLLSRGDGGTYFGHPSQVQNISTGFTSVQAGSNINIKATDTNNVLPLQPGAGIEFYQEGGTCGTGSPQLHIYATAPEQIQVSGGGSGTLNFANLTNEPCDDRILYFAGADDTYVNISATTVIIGSQYNSSLSTVQHLISTVDGIQDEQSTLNYALMSTLALADLLLVSTGIAELYDIVAYTEAVALATSSFVFSTFAADVNGNHTILNINQINANNVVAENIVTSIVSAYNVDVGSNALYDINLPGDVPQLCEVLTENGSVSTFTNYFSVKDQLTNVEFSFEKAFLVSLSTSVNSTFQTFGESLQFGFFPYLSTQGTRQASSLANLYVPILQQIEVLEQVVTSSLTGGFTSTQTNYSLQNILKVDEICSGGDLKITATNVSMNNLTTSTLATSSMTAGSATIDNAYISTLSTYSFYSDNLNVSSINGLTVDNLGSSTFGFINVDVINPSTVGAPVTVSSVNISSINGISITNLGGSTFTGIYVDVIMASTLGNHVTISTLAFSTAVADNLFISTIEVSTLCAYRINVISVSSYTISTIDGSFSQIVFDTANGNTLQTSTLNFDNGIGSSIQVSTIMGYDLPIFTFDLYNRRVGVNLGAEQQPRATVDISGIVFANAFVTSSDRRLKTHITEYEAPLTIPRAYRYCCADSSESDIGVMADEIETIAPECIYNRPDGYKAVNYNKLVPICFSLLRRLSDRIESLESVVARNIRE